MQNNRLTWGALLLAAAFCIYAFPENSTPFKTQTAADVLAICALVLFVLFESKLIAGKSMARVLMVIGVLGILSTMSALMSSGGIGDAVLTFRYIYIIPCVYYILGFLQARSGDGLVWKIMIPAAILNLILMSITITRPYVGNYLTEDFVSLEGRYFIFPIGSVVIKPVTVSEACSVSFAFLFLGLESGRGKYKRVLLFMGAAAFTLSLLSTTRTYIFATVATLCIVLFMSLIGRHGGRAALKGVSIISVSTIILLAIPRTREFISARVTRLETELGLINTSGRMELWQDRLAMLSETSWTYGLSVSDYRLVYALSSHNLLLDIAIIGGLLFLVLAVCFLLHVNIQIMRVLLTLQNSELRFLAATLLMFCLAFMVSSPLISSKQTLAAAFYFAGAFYCRLNLLKNHAKNS